MASNKSTHFDLDRNLCLATNEYISVNIFYFNRFVNAGIHICGKTLAGNPNRKNSIALFGFSVAEILLYKTPIPNHESNPKFEFV